MDTIVASLDKPLPQVAIEAKIVFVDRTDVQELGIVYDLKEREGGFVEQVSVNARRKQFFVRGTGPEEICQAAGHVDTRYRIRPNRFAAFFGAEEKGGRRKRG